MRVFSRIIVIDRLRSVSSIYLDFYHWCRIFINDFSAFFVFFQLHIIALSFSFSILFLSLSIPLSLTKNIVYVLTCSMFFLNLICYDIYWIDYITILILLMKVKISSFNNTTCYVKGLLTATVLSKRFRVDLMNTTVFSVYLISNPPFTLSIRSNLKSSHSSSITVCWLFMT